MLLSLAQWLHLQSPEFGTFRVFQYITFRAVMAALTSLLIGLLAGPYVIRRLTELKIGQPIRGYGMESHLAKRGTPTMGGVLILLSISISTSTRSPPTTMPTSPPCTAGGASCSATKCAVASLSTSAPSAIMT